MKLSGDALAKLIEDALARLKIRPDQIQDQIPSSAVPPATASATGGVQLSDATPTTTGTADSGTDTDVSRADHVHALETHSLTGAFHTASGLTTGQVLRATGATAFAFGALDLANTDAVTGILAAANGGVGGAGGTNRIAVFSGTNAVTSDSNFTYSAGGVGIVGAPALIQLTTASDSVQPNIVLRRARAGPAATQSADTLFVLSGRGHDGSNYIAANTGQIRLIADETYSSTNQGTAFVVDLMAIGTTSRTTVLKVDGDGNLGLGGQTTFGTSATRSIAIKTGTAPSGSLTDAFQLFSADANATAGRAWPHFRPETGTNRAVVGVTATTAAGASTRATKGGTTADNAGWLTVNDHAGNTVYVPYWSAT